MNDRERLVELIHSALSEELKKNKIYSFPVIEGEIADYLLKNGVTFPVRCRECKYYMPYTPPFGTGKYYCDQFSEDDLAYTEPTSFCGYGELKENEK